MKVEWVSPWYLAPLDEPGWVPVVRVSELRQEVEHIIAYDTLNIDLLRELLASLPKEETR